MKKTIYIVLIIFIYSCQNGNLYIKNTKVIDLSGSFVEKKQLNLSSIASSVEYIALESSKESWIANIQALKFTYKHIYVLDDIQNLLLQFDLKGNFKRKIGVRGNGPDEYNKISNFGVSIPIQGIEMICMSDYQNGNIYIYDEEGNFKNKFKPESTSSAVEFLNEKSVLTTVTDPSSSDYNHSYTLNLCALNGKILSQYTTSDIKLDKNSVLSKVYLSRYQNKIQYYDTYDFGLYEISPDDNKIKRKYVFDLGDNGLSTDEIIDQAKKRSIGISKRGTLDGDIIESRNFFFANLNYKNTMVTAFYSKEDKKTVDVIFNLDVIDHGFHNDLDGGIPFWPLGTTPDGKWFSYFNPIWAKEKLKNPYFDTFEVKNEHLRKKFREFINNKNEYDNPIIQLTIPR